MKNINKILFTFCTLMVMSACVDEDKLFELDDFETGALPNLARTANDLGFIDSFNFGTTPIEFTIDFTNEFAQSDDGGLTSGGSGKVTTDTEFRQVASVDLEVSYSSVVSGTTVSGFLTNITSWPATISYVGVGELVAAIPTLNSSADISVGDVFTFVCAINFADGTSLPAFIEDPNGNMVPNYSVNFAGTGNNPGYDFAITHNVSCSSDLADATVYDVSTSVTGTCCGLPVGTFAGNTATVTEIGVGQYQISDFLNDYFAPFNGPGVDEPIVVIDVCNTITVDPATCPATSFLCYGSNTTDPVGGSYDEGTGVWVISWEDSFGNGIRGITTLTPQ